MSYEVCITRRKDWTKAPEKPIALEEWLRVVGKHPDLKPTKVHSHQLPDGRLLEIGLGEGGVLWMGHPDLPTGVAFQWFEGEISVTARGGPGEDLEKLLKTLARELDAFVLGEEGEEY